MSSPQLPGVFATLAPVLDHYGYLAVAGFVFVEDFGVPVPGETILIAASVYAGAGRLNIVLVAGLALLAAVLGDNVGFAIGHFGGRRAVLRWGRYVLITPSRLKRTERWFHRHGGKIVTVARFVEGLRQANGIVAGVAGMPWRRFLTFNAIGAVLWVGVWTTVGEVSGSHIGAVYHIVRRVGVYLIGAAAAAIAVRIGVHLYRRRRGHRVAVEASSLAPASKASGNPGEPGPREDRGSERRAHGGVELDPPRRAGADRGDGRGTGTAAGDRAAGLSARVEHRRRRNGRRDRG